MQSDWLFLFEPFRKIIALKNLFDSHMRSQTDEPIRAGLVHPLRVEADLSLVRIEKLEDLAFVGFGVRVDFFTRQLRSGGALSGRVTNQTGEISDQKNDCVAQLLKCLQFANNNRMTQMDVGSGRVGA